MFSNRYTSIWYNNKNFIVETCSALIGTVAGSAAVAIIKIYIHFRNSKYTFLCICTSILNIIFHYGAHNIADCIISIKSICKIFSEGTECFHLVTNESTRCRHPPLLRHMYIYSVLFVHNIWYREVIKYGAN